MRAIISAYRKLSKIRISVMVVLTALMGFYLGSESPSYVLAIALSLGTGLLASGASSFNQVIERNFDAQMLRTQSRPLVEKILTVRHAFGFSLLLTIVGGGILLYFFSTLSFAIGMITHLSYVFVYTPLKRKTHLSTLVGAVPGALPPVIGWVAATGSIQPLAVILFLLLFFWQMPHFLAIGWLYVSDYRKAHFPILPVVDRGDKAFTARQSLLYAVVLLPLVLFPTLLGYTGIWYVGGSFILTTLFIGLNVRLFMLRTTAAARWVLLGSVIYLPLLLILMILDKV